MRARLVATPADSRRDPESMPEVQEPLLEHTPPAATPEEKEEGRQGLILSAFFLFTPSRLPHRRRKWRISLFQSSREFLATTLYTLIDDAYITSSSNHLLDAAPRQAVSSAEVKR